MNDKQRQQVLGTAILLFAITLSSTGCKTGNFPTPNLAFWKKDNIRLSKQSNEVAPPSRHFAPEPGHFADSAHTPSQVAKNDSSEEPLREPYSFDLPGESKSLADDFGFPKGSDSLTGSNPKTGDYAFKEPNANEFRAAMGSSAEKAKSFATDTQTKANDAFRGAQNFLAESKKQAQDAASKSNSFLANAKEAAQEATKPNAGMWKEDFKLPDNRNELVGRDFNASVKKATEDAKKSMQSFNQRALDQLNNSQFGSADNAIAKSANTFQRAAEQVAANTNQSLEKATGQFGQSWNSTIDKSLEKAKQANQSLQSFSGLNSQSTAQSSGSGGQFGSAKSLNASANQFAAQAKSTFEKSVESLNQFAGNARDSANQIASTTDQYTSGLGQFNSNNAPTDGSEGLSSFASKSPADRRAIGGSFDKKMETPGRSQFQGNNQFGSKFNQLSEDPSAANSIAKTLQPKPDTSSAGSQYPSTNFAPYQRERISTVTPLQEQTNLPILRAKAEDTTDSSTVRTAGIPPELMRGNSTFAPGSIKGLNPIN